MKTPYYIPRNAGWTKTKIAREFIKFMVALKEYQDDSPITKYFINNQGEVHKVHITWAAALLTPDDCRWYVDKDYEIMEYWGAQNSLYKERMEVALIQHPRFETWFKAFEKHVNITI